MPIVAADLVAYGAVSRPEDDVSTSGGARDAVARPNLIQLTANSVIAAVSSAADTRTLLITGRDAGGAIVTDSFALNGTSEVVGTQTFERILKLNLSATGAQTVEVRQGSAGAVRCTMAPQQEDAFAFFIKAQSESGATTRFEKLFWQNDHATLTLSDAEVTLTADPDSKFRIGLETAKDDTVSVANRETTPSNPTFVDDSVAQSVPGGTLAAAERIGVWIEFSLTADNAALKTSFTTQLAGTTI